MPQTHPSPPNMALSIAIMGGLFFILGFFTWLNGPLISFVQVAFEVNEISAFLVLMVFYLSYFFLAIPSSWILRRTGMKKGLALSLLVMAASTVAFGQFATMRLFPGVLACLFVLGGGMALLQTSINPYISMIGPIETAARRIAIMGICNKTAGILAPLVLGALVLHGMGDLVTEVAAADPTTRDALLTDFAGSIRSFYLVMCAILVMAAIGIWVSPLPEIQAETANAASADDKGQERTSIFQFPHLWLGVVCLFLYVGVEVMAGDAIGTYGNAFGLPLDHHDGDAGRLLGRIGADPALLFTGALAGNLGHTRSDTDTRCVFDKRLYIRRIYGLTRVCQCDHVGGDFSARHSRAGQVYPDWFCPVGDGDFRRRDHPATVRSAQALCTRVFPGIFRHADDSLLSVYSLFCHLRA